MQKAYSATLINCGNDNSNIYGYQFAGGLIARSDSSILIDRTYNTGLIEGIECVAGLVGSISISKPSYILNSYHRGKIRNNKRISNRFNEYFYLDYEHSTLVYQNLYTTDSLDAYQCDSCTDINIFHMKWDEKDSTGLTAKKMKAREFAERLGEAFAYDSLGVNGGFPILSGKEVPLPIIVKDSLAHKKVAVFDVKGSPVWSGRATRNSLSVPISKPGIYIVRCGNKARKAIIY